MAVVLSAQATDAGVNKATPALFALADTPEKMAALGEDRVRDLIKTIGLFRTKAKNVVELSQPLIAEHGGQVPRSREALEALPGVGRKTANVVLNIAFGEPTIAVDTHIFRVGNRTGMAPGKNPLEVEQKLEQAVPAQYKRHAHHWLILHGRYTCLARKPRCESCLIADLCQWPEKTVANSGPGRGAWKALPAVNVVDRGYPSVILEHAGLPPRGVAMWLNAKPRFRDKFKRDAAAGTRFWRGGTNLLAKLPKKPLRTPEQQLAADVILFRCRDARERFLAAHAENVYRKLTNKLENFLRVDELAYEAAKLVPGLTPTQRQVNAESRLMQSEKDGVEIDQGIFLAQVLAIPETGMHLCHAMLRPKMESIERVREFISNDVIDFGPAKVERQGKAAVVTVKNSRFLNAEDDDTLDDTETAADIAILDPMSEICVLRGGVVDHPKYNGRKVFSAGINLTHLYRGKIPYLWYMRRDMGVVNKMLRGLAMRAREAARRRSRRRDEKPWISGLDVFAIGGGCQYLLVMDYVVAGATPI